MTSEKNKIAITSVVAAVFLTSMKLIVGLLTGSLGIISEAIHSGLDLGSTLLTLFAVNISDKPADKTHNFGHGKIENLSALIQTILLLITCGWIIHEAIVRLVAPVSIEVNFFSFLVIGISIVVDVARTRVLIKAAKKYNSQVLEADAYHFSSDILSSAVVIIGLIFVSLGIPMGDPIAALAVSIVVVFVSAKLGKRTIEALLDSAPKGMSEKVREIITQVPGVIECPRSRARGSGSRYFIDTNIGIDRHFSHNEIQGVIHQIKSKIRETYPNTDIMVSTYPIQNRIFKTESENFFDEIRSIVNSSDMCLNLHHLKTFVVESGKHLALHVEICKNISLEETHDMSHQIESKIKSAYSDITGIDVIVQSTNDQEIVAQNVTDEHQETIENIKNLINKSPDKLNCHNIKIYKEEGGLVVFLHCGIKGNHKNDFAQKVAKGVAEKIKKNIKDVRDVFVHAEPIK
jgi:cation diffusion facilitator family transporter